MLVRAGGVPADSGILLEGHNAMETGWIFFNPNPCYTLMLISDPHLVKTIQLLTQTLTYNSGQSSFVGRGGKSIQKYQQYQDGVGIGTGSMLAWYWGVRFPPNILFLCRSSSITPPNRFSFDVLSNDFLFLHMFFNIKKCTQICLVFLFVKLTWYWSIFRYL